jgi:4-amino-4-deoxy-L-arabinose transferase-like glycosyltransferase
MSAAETDPPLEAAPRPAPSAADASPGEPRLTPAGTAGRSTLAALLERHEVALACLLACVVLLVGLGSYTLIDPWETHYGEVARRILADNDWVFLRWQDESFRSKPILTFWLMAAGMRALGVATDGGYSGELTGGDLPVLALRLPFALFAVLGATTTFWMLRRLVSRRAAWLALVALLASPFFTLVGRQAITDMPALACIMAALSCFIVAICDGEEPIRPIWRRLDPSHIYLAVLTLVVAGQGLYYLLYFHASPVLAPGLRVWQPGWLVGGGTLLGFAALLGIDLFLVPIRRKRQLLMRWAYLFGAISVLAKGPVGPAIIGVTCAAYLLLVEGEWRILIDGRRDGWRKYFLPAASLPQGLLIIALVTVPWHVAMYWKDGRGFVREYFGTHWFGRFNVGVFGDRGTFDYFTSQLALGMAPLIGLVPFALAWLALRPLDRSRRGRALALVGIWAVVGFGVIAWSATKFHHYILTAVPPLAIALGLWLDDAWERRDRSLALAALGGILAVALVARDLVGEQKQLIEMFVFRYDRLWPSAAPWNVDLGGPIIALAAVAVVAMIALAFRRLRRPAIVLVLGSALGFTVWAANGYMSVAATHWGQRDLQRTYYRLRDIHGVEIKYYSLRDLADDWADGEYRVRSVLPDGFRVGLAARARLIVPGVGLPADTLELGGTVAAIGEDAFTVRLDAVARAKVADLVARGQRLPRGATRRPWVQVDADRLIAWRLNWRGENFWSGGEIYGATEDTRTVFDKTDNVAFLKYIKAPARAGRRFFVVTESQTANLLKGILPTERGRQTVKIVDTTSNKFTLLELRQ